jgi:predicted TIM-barrel fold metal-dependent hydrolase
MDQPPQDVSYVILMKPRGTTVSDMNFVVGPIIEAFGFSRIIFATSSSSGAESNSSPGNWYEMAREAVAELGIDQDGVNAIFGGNAKTLYGAA